MELALEQLEDYILYYAIHQNWKGLDLLLSSSTKWIDTDLCIFWSAFCSLKRNDIIKSAHAFKQIHPNSDFYLAALCGLAETHLIDSQQDDEELDHSHLSKIKSNIKKLSKTENIEILMKTAVYFWHIGRLKQARHYTQKAVQLNEHKVSSLAVAGWIHLSEESSKYRKKAATYFLTALSIVHKEQKDKDDESYALPLLAMYGLARCYQIKGKLSKSIECMTQLIVHNQWFVDGLAIKSELLLMAKQHKQCIDTVHRVLNTAHHSNNIHALVIKLCYFLMYNGNHTQILQQLQSLYALLIDEYKLNEYVSYASLFYLISNITSKFIIHSTKILEMCQKFMSFAVELEPENAAYLTLQANLYLYLGYIQTALSLFRDASSFDENNIEALCGAVYCRVLNGDVIEAQNELQFLTETVDADDVIHKKSKRSSVRKEYLTYLQAIIAWKADHDEDEFNFCIKSALKQYTERISCSRFSQFDDLAIHDPRFCLMIASEYLKHAPSEPLSTTDPPSTYLNECSAILQEVCDRVPGVIDARLLRARCKYLEGDLYGTESILMKLKESDADYWRVHLLQCQVALHGNSIHEAQTCLDTAIGLNFHIQTSLIYHIIKAKLAKIK